MACSPPGKELASKPAKPSCPALVRHGAGASCDVCFRDVHSSEKINIEVINEVDVKLNGRNIEILSALA